MKSKLNKQQKKYIKACDCKELRKELKRFLKKENKSFNKKSEKHIKQKIANKILINGLVWEPLIVLDEAKREEFEKINGKGFPWYKESLKEVEERFKEATKKYMPNPNEKIKYEFVQSSNGKIGFPSKNSITKETLESLTNPDLIDKRKEFHNAIDEHIEKGKDELDFLFKKEKHTEPLEFDLPKKDIGTHTVELKEDSIIFKEIDDSIVEFIGKNTNVIFKRIGDYYGMSIDLDSMTKEQHKEFFKICNNHREKYGIVSETPKSKTFSKEDMFKCFYESRLTNPIVGFKFESFASYLESMQK